MGWPVRIRRLEAATPPTVSAAEIAVLDGADPTGLAPVAGKALILPAALGLGAKNGGTVTVIEERFDGIVHQTKLQLTATPIVLTDDADAGQYGGVKIYDMPAGNISFLGASVAAIITLTETEWVDNTQGDVGVGTTAPTDGDALATTEQNIIPTTAVAALVAQVGPINCQSAGVVNIAGAGAADVDVYLNVRIDDNAAHITGGGTITGTVTITWINNGDF